MKTGKDRTCKSPIAFSKKGFQMRVLFRKFNNFFPRSISGTIIDHQNINIREQVINLLHQRNDVVALIKSGNANEHFPLFSLSHDHLARDKYQNREAVRTRHNEFGQYSASKDIDSWDNVHNVDSWMALYRQYSLEVFFQNVRAKCPKQEEKYCRKYHIQPLPGDRENR